MTLSLTHANTLTPAPTGDLAKDVPTSTEKKTLAIIVKSFWAYTDAASETNTKSFEGLL